MTNYTIVDELGRLLARKAELECEEQRLKEQLHEMGPGSYEGRLFRATVGQDGTSIRRDSQAMRDRLWALSYYAFVKAHEQEVERRGSIRVVAKTGRDLDTAVA